MESRYVRVVMARVSSVGVVRARVSSVGVVMARVSSVGVVPPAPPTVGRGQKKDENFADIFSFISNHHPQFFLFYYTSGLIHIYYS